MLSVDTVFLWFALAYALWLAPNGLLWLLSGLLAFVVYRVVVTVGFLAIREMSQPERTDVLLLRPFSLGARSEWLFDNLGKDWLRIGTVHMIAGPDLVRSTVSPPEFLSFLGGRLARRFITDGRQLEQHLKTMDLRQDPDGRYRINQLFCGDDVWRQAMTSLASLGTVVFMDLRGFTHANQGCVFEILELVRRVPLQRIVFAVDDTTERAYLDHIVPWIWENLPEDSPNRGAVGLDSRFVHMDNSGRSRRRLLAALLEGTVV